MRRRHMTITTPQTSGHVGACRLEAAYETHHAGVKVTAPNSPVLTHTQYRTRMGMARRLQTRER